MNYGSSRPNFFWSSNSDGRKFWLETFDWPIICVCFGERKVRANLDRGFPEIAALTLKNEQDLESVK